MANKKKTLEEEIDETSRRIEARQKTVEAEIEVLEKRIKRYTAWAWGFVIFGFLIAIIGLITYSQRDTNYYFLNLLGDFYGGSVASIWSLAGLFFIYVAFLGQKQQLLNQQMEIMYSQLEVKYTRLELSGQKAEMTQQNATLKKQQFDNTFFQLLANHNSLVNAIDLTRNRTAGTEVIARGRDCFVTFYNKFRKKIPIRGPFLIDKVLENYLEFYEENQSDLGHYFRNLYHIIKFVDESEIEDKKRYTNFVRAQLSAPELLLLFYNCLSKHGNEKFKPLIERYALLKNMNKDYLFEKKHEDEYKEAAYK